MHILHNKFAPHKLAKARLPVVYRWLRRQRYFPYGVLLCCALIALPVGLIGGVRISHIVSSNTAQAAGRGLIVPGAALRDMSAEERGAHAALLRDLAAADPASLRSMIGQDMLMILNSPELKRQEGGVTVWQYRTESCVLDVFFNGDQGVFAPVVHYEFRPRHLAAFGKSGPAPETRVDESACLKALYQQRAI